MQMCEKSTEKNEICWKNDLNLKYLAFQRFRKLVSFELLMFSNSFSMSDFVSEGLSFT